MAAFFYIVLAATLCGMALGACSPEFPCQDYSSVTVETLQSCSLLVPMDHAYYSSASAIAGQVTGAGAFNSKVYGLLFRLLHDDVLMKWVIRPGKVKVSGFDEPDVVKSVRQLLPVNSTTYATRNFTSGVFAVPPRFRTKFLTIVDQYHANLTDKIRVYELNSVQNHTLPSVSGMPLLDGLMVPVAYTINRKPYVAVFDSSGMQDVQLNLMAAAGLIRDNDLYANGTTAPLGALTPIPKAHYRLMSKNDASTIGSSVCVTMASEPHFHYYASPQESTVYEFMEAAARFVRSGGNFLAQCGGVFTYEQCDSATSPCTNGTLGFQTTAGFQKLTKPNAGDGVLNHFPSHPSVQFDGLWEYSGGSIPGYAPAVGSSYRNDSYRQAFSLISSQIP